MRHEDGTRIEADADDYAALMMLCRSRLPPLFAMILRSLLRHTPPHVAMPFSLITRYAVTLIFRHFR